jgi:hypothetical protein
MKNQKRKKKIIQDDDLLQFYHEIVNKEKAIAAKLKELEPVLLKKKNLVGYGVGFKRLKGVYSNELAAIFFVDKKQSSTELSKKDIFPSFITVNGKKIRTDIVEVHRMRKNANLGDPTLNRNRYRPVEMGVGIRICQQGTNTTLAIGTAGALVKEKQGTTRYILTAGHVADTVGSDVIQPDSGANPADKIGGVTVIAGSDLNTGIDAGIIEVINSLADIISLGMPNQPISPFVGLNVQKSGRQTGYTQSSIYYTNVTMMNLFVSLLPPAITAPVFPVANGLFFVLNASPNVTHILNPYPFFGMLGDSGALIVAGWNNYPDRISPQHDQLFAVLGTLPNGPAQIQSIIKRTNCAALGLLLETASFPMITGAGAIAGSVDMVIGQEINMALNALNVELITR